MTAIRAFKGAFASMLAVLPVVALFGLIEITVHEGVAADVVPSLLAMVPALAIVTMAAALLFGWPVYLLLKRLQRSVLPWLIGCGVVCALLIATALYGPFIWTNLLDLFTRLLWIFVAFGASAAVGFWYGVERWVGT